MFVFVILLLLAANAFFAAAEFSLVSLRDTRIQQLIEAGRVGARTVLKLHRNIDQVVNGVQFGITLTSLSLGWVGEPVLAHMVERSIGHVPYAAVYAHSIAVVIAFCLITFLHVILGELVPKSLALQRAERIALAVAGPMDVFLTVGRPFLYLMRSASGWVLHLLGSRNVAHGAVHSPDELKLIATASRQLGQIPEIQEEMIHGALELDSITVREVMVPRPSIFSLPGNLNLEEALDRIVREQHSRVPIYDPLRGPEHIVGVLYAKDVMRWLKLRLNFEAREPISARIANMPVSRIMHDVLVVPETKVLTELLTEFKDRRRHMAVVVDEYGSTAGVVTVEDILEQLVGEIEDEYDVASAEQTGIDDGNVLVLDGAVSIRDLESQYDLTLPRDAGFETLAGFVLARLQRIPQQGESFEFEGRRYTVEEVDGRRVARVRIENLEQPILQQAG